jgi:hypothetical protein
MAKTTEHYEHGQIECVDYLFDNMPFEAFVGFLEGNVKKYLHRWRYKGAPIKDLRKSRDYLNVLIAVMEGQEPKFGEWNNDETENTCDCDDFNMCDDCCDGIERSISGSE